MRLTVVGSGGGIRLAKDATSGYLVTHEATSLLVECGAGVATRLRRYTRLKNIVGVVISHMHLACIYDLIPLAVMIYGEQVDSFTWEHNYPPSQVSRPLLPVYLPPGGAEYLQRVMQAIGGSPNPSGEPLTNALTSTFALHEYEPDVPFPVGPFIVHPIGPVAHSPSICFGLRISRDTETVGYSGDSALCDALYDIAQDTGLFLCDATGITSEVRRHRHLSADEAGMIAARAKAKHLVLTHIAKHDQSWHDALIQAARTHYSGPITIATGGRRFRISRQNL